MLLNSICLQILSKTLDSTALTPEKVELATIVHDSESNSVCPYCQPLLSDVVVAVSVSMIDSVAQVLYHMYEEAELKPLLEAANADVAKERESEA